MAAQPSSTVSRGQTLSDRQMMDSLRFASAKVIRAVSKLSMVYSIAMLTSALILFTFHSRIIDSMFKGSYTWIIKLALVSVSLNVGKFYTKQRISLVLGLDGNSRKPEAGRNRSVSDAPQSQVLIIGAEIWWNMTEILLFLLHAEGLDYYLIPTFCAIEYMFFLSNVYRLWDKKEEEIEMASQETVLNFSSLTSHDRTSRPSSRKGSTLHNELEMRRDSSKGTDPLLESSRMSQSPSTDIISKMYSSGKPSQAPGTYYSEKRRSSSENMLNGPAIQKSAALDPMRPPINDTSRDGHHIGKVIANRAIRQRADSYNIPTRDGIIKSNSFERKEEASATTRRTMSAASTRSYDGGLNSVSLRSSAAIGESLQDKVKLKALVMKTFVNSLVKLLAVIQLYLLYLISSHHNQQYLKVTNSSLLMGMLIIYACTAVSVNMIGRMAGFRPVQKFNTSVDGSNGAWWSLSAMSMGWCAIWVIQHGGT